MVDGLFGRPAVVGWGRGGDGREEVVPLAESVPEDAVLLEGEVSPVTVDTRHGDEAAVREIT
jgi:hypothetical protein